MHQVVNYNSVPLSVCYKNHMDKNISPADFLMVARWLSKNSLISIKDGNGRKKIKCLEAIMISKPVIRAKNYCRYSK
jgi:hypothetical protein